MQNTIYIQNCKIPIKVQRSSNRKKTLSVKMTEDGIVALSPMGLSQTKILNFIDRRKERIHEKRQLQQQKTAHRKEFVSGEKFYYRGRKYKLKVYKNQNIQDAEFRFYHGKFQSHLPKGLDKSFYKKTIQTKMTKWYKNRAFKVIEDRARKLADKYDFETNNIIIKSYKSKFGQCRAQDVYFNYKIIKFPIYIINHIILHELVHLKYKNHSKNFWNLLGVLDDGIIEHKRWLAEKGNFIIDIGG